MHYNIKYIRTPIHTFCMFLIIPYYHIHDECKVIGVIEGEIKKLFAHFSIIFVLFTIGRNVLKGKNNINLLI